MNAQDLLQKKIPAEYDYKIHVVTNRNISEIDDKQFIAEAVYNNEGQFTYLTAYGSEDNWTFKEEESMTVMMNQDQLYKDWLVFVHGDSKTMLTAVERAKEIQKLHHVNVLVYSWPSKDPDLSPIANFKNSYSNVELATAYFKEFLLMVDDLKNSDYNQIGNQNMSLFLHSLGNYFLQSMVADGLHTGLDENLFDNLIINAAAVEEKDHHLWVEKLNFSDRVYINSNDDDFSLTGLRILTKLGRQLGENPREPYAENAIYVSFTEAVGFPGSMGPSHSYYFASIPEKSENIKKYYTGIFHGLEAQLTNNQLFAYKPKQGAYAIIF